jgi:molybdopterin-guanine dinucleotide biosynthesis protein A
MGPHGEDAASELDDPADRGERADATGVVLAGGRSTRFDGGDKALAVVDGTPMLARVVGRLGTVTDDVVVNCRDDQRAAFERPLADVDVPVRFAIDDRPDEGPLVALDTVLAAVSAPHVVVVACDIPFLDPDFVAALLGTVDTEAGSPNAAVPVDDEGFRKPTCAAYRTDALASAVTDALAAGTLRLGDALDELDVRTVSPEALDASRLALADANTRAELDRLLSAFETNDDE